jgi:hypothetical protein
MTAIFMTCSQRRARPANSLRHGQPDRARFRQRHRRHRSQSARHHGVQVSAHDGVRVIGVRKHDRVVADIDDAGIRRRRLRDLMGILSTLGFYMGALLPGQNRADPPAGTPSQPGA